MDNEKPKRIRTAHIAFVQKTMEGATGILVKPITWKIHQGKNSWDWNLPWTKAWKLSKNYPLPHSCLFLVLWFVFFRRLIALTFDSNTRLMKVWVWVCIGFSEFNKQAMCKISHSHFSPPCCLYYLFKRSTAHISFWLSFAILWVDWSIKIIFTGLPLTEDN